MRPLPESPTSRLALLQLRPLASRAPPPLSQPSPLPSGLPSPTASRPMVTPRLLPPTIESSMRTLASMPSLPPLPGLPPLRSAAPPLGPCTLNHAPHLPRCRRSESTEDLVGPTAREEACVVVAYARISIEDARFAAIVFVVVWTVRAEACTAEGICIAAARE
jgi:hypothetical protein